MKQVVPMLLVALMATALMVQPLLAVSGEKKMNHSAAVVFSFERGSNAPDWYSVDDRVMGGVSRSLFQTTDDGLGVFRGVLSLENNGGFASVRAETGRVDLSSYDSISMRIKGDGRSYKFCLKTDNSWDGILYQASFDTKAGEWMDVVIPMNEFRPMWRGRWIPQAGELRTDRIKTFGLMLADKQPGEFKLELDWIAAYSRETIERRSF